MCDVWAEGIHAADSESAFEAQRGGRRSQRPAPALNAIPDDEIQEDSSPPNSSGYQPWGVSRAVWPDVYPLPVWSPSAVAFACRGSRT